GCDSLLELDGEPHGNPPDAAEAVARWRRLRGRTRALHTGHCVRRLPGGRGRRAGASPRGHFADVSDAEIDAYVATGEPLTVAGAFTLDGLGGPYVERIEGDPGPVVGLALPLLRHLLGDLDISIIDLWAGG